MLSNGWLVHCRMESWVTNPDKIINGPNELSGRLRHATIPAKMYGSVTHHDEQDAKGRLVELLVDRREPGSNGTGGQSRYSECPQQGWLRGGSVPFRQQRDNCSHPNLSS